MQICAIVENNSIDRYNRAISKCQSKWVHTSCHGFWPPSSPLLSLATSIPFQVDWTSNFKTAPLRLFWNKILLWIKVAPPPDILICRVAKSENFPDSKIFVAKTFRIKRVNRANFQIRDKCA